MTNMRALRHVGPALLALALPCHAGQAAGPPCPPPKAWNSSECPPQISTPRGYPTKAGTVTVHPGIPFPCTVRLPGGAVLCAGGETAWPYNQSGPHARPQGRAIFRISGSGPGGPGGLNIVVSASDSNAPNAPELLPQLYADAVVSLPPGTVLLRLDAATGRFLPVPNGHLRQAALYKIVRRGAAPTLQPAPAALPSTLPATGGSPFGALWAMAAIPFSALWALAALLLVAGVWLLRSLLPLRRHGHTHARPPVSRARFGLILLAGGVLLAAASGLAYAVIGAGSTVASFGALDQAGGPTVMGRGASTAPTRLAIPRLGIDTPVVSLGIAGGAWQVPSFAAGYLAGGAWPGHAGNEVITGHDDRDGAVFRRLGDLRPGDVVAVYAGGRAYRYAVTALRVVPATRVDLLRQTRGATLTLITCTPYLVDTQRLVARARLVAV